MATCKDCLSHDVCFVVRRNGNDRVLTNSPCKHFLSNTDIAKEIFGEIENLMDYYKYFCDGNYDKELETAVTKLKSKYVKE